MSVNIKITEGNTVKGFTADKLKVPLEAGGYELLVPESAVGLGELNATVNRRYRASEDGLFAYSVVKANVPEGGSITGKGPDGKKYKVTVDDGGNIIETPEGAGYPVRIAVTTPPTNPYGIYQDGQTISTEGMVVKAYYDNGDEYGIVPNREITINPTTAVYDESTDTGFATATSDLIDFAVPIGYIANPIFKPTTSTFTLNVGVSITDSGPAGFIKDGGALFIYFASDHPETGSYVVDKYGRKPNPAGGPPYEYELKGSTSYGPVSMTSQYTYNNKTVYWTEVMLMNQGGVDYPGTLDVDSWPVSIRPKVAWTMVYGNIGQAGGHQTITVSWPRPGDGAILETTFEILVAPPYYTDDEA